MNDFVSNILNRVTNKPLIKTPLSGIEAAKPEFRDHVASRSFSVDLSGKLDRKRKKNNKRFFVDLRSRLSLYLT